jgi:hypothetical protein
MPNRTYNIIALNQPRVYLSGYVSVDMVFWLIGANASIMKIHFKCIFKKSKKIEQKIPGMHMNILCPSIKVLLRKDIFCGLCKNDKKQLRK